MKTKNLPGKFSIANVVSAILIACTFLAEAQPVTITEGFDQSGPYPAQNLPFGWNQGKVSGIDPDNYFDRVSAGVSPAVAPRSPSAMIRYRSNLTTAGEASYIVSKPFDLTNRGAATSNFRFWMYRDLGFAPTGTAPTAVGLAGTNTITVSSAAGIVIGQSVFGTGIGFNAVVVGIAGTTITLSVNNSIAVSGTVNFYNQSSDNIQVYVNDSAVLSGGPTGAVLLNDTASGVNRIYRYANCYPMAAGNTNGWNLYGYTIPAGAPWSSSNVYVFIVATSQMGNDIHIDDFSIVTDPKDQNYTSCDLVLQNGANVGPGTVNNWVVSMRIIVDGSRNPYRANTIIFNTNGCTNPCGDITGTGAKLWWTGGTNTLDLTIAQQIGTGQSPCMTNYTFTSAAGFRLDNGTNYFWITYDIQPGATGGNFVDAEFVSVALSLGVLGNGTQSPGTATLPGAREIDLAYCIPTYTVGTAWNGYNNNDYIQCVILNGEIGYPIINNCLNTVGPNAGGCTGGPCAFSTHPPDYEKFAAVPGKTTVLKADAVTTYTLQSQVGTYWSGNCLAAWIDYNHDGVFQPAEKLGQTVYPPGLGGGGWWNQNFTVPLASYIGNTTLRVRETWINNNIDPCATYTYGEVEDYTVTIIPDCNILPGWRVWLGAFSDDWNLPQNWCGGVPTIATDAAILPDIDVVAPGVQAPPNQPVIKANVTATTRKLRIEGPDTLTIDAYTGGSLTMADSLTIKNANTQVKVISSYNGSMVISNGNLVNSNSYPFNGAFARARMQIVYTQAELLARGLVAGDIINTLQFIIGSRNSGQPYNNFNINYYYTTPDFSFASVPAAWAPVAAAGGNLYSGTLDLTAGANFIPLGGAGTITIALTAPLTWNGSGNDLVLEICYDNPSTTSADQTFVTQTIGVRKVARVWGLAAGAPAGCALVPGSGGTVRQGNDFRPNVTFLFSRTYTKFPINLRGHLGNNGTFIAGNSIFTFNSTTMQQNIDGTSNTTFHELAINNAFHVRQNTAATVDDTLWLQAGRLLLNTRTLTLNNGRAGAINRTSGYLYSEDLPPNYGSLNWKIGSFTGIHTVPFIQISGAYIPFIYDVTSGTSDLTIATYRTPPNNLPMPAGVTSIGGYYSPFTADNSPNMVDRYWIISEPGAGVNANITFTFAGNEATGVPPPYSSQRWSGAIWELPTPGQSSTATTNISPGITLLNTPWALTTQPQPLPVNLLNLSAKAEDKKVRVHWTTVSELNTDHFIVERTTDNKSYIQIGDAVIAKGFSTSNNDYEVIDMNPVIGKQFYRLKQVDFDRNHKYFGPVAVNFGRASLFDILTISHQNAKAMTVIFESDASQPYSLKLMDATGRIISSNNNLWADEGINYLELNVPLDAGIYSVMLQNSSKVVTRKFFK